MQCLLHPWIRQTETLLQQVNAQNGLEGKGLTTAFGARACRRERLDQTHQLPLRNSQVHLVEKHTLARALGDKLESAAVKLIYFIFIQPLSGSAVFRVLQRSPSTPIWHTQSHYFVLILIGIFINIFKKYFIYKFDIKNIMG